MGKIIGAGPLHVPSAAQSPLWIPPFTVTNRHRELFPSAKRWMDGGVVEHITSVIFSFDGGTPPIDMPSLVSEDSGEAQLFMRQLADMTDILWDSKSPEEEEEVYTRICHLVAKTCVEWGLPPPEFDINYLSQSRLRNAPLVKAALAAGWTAWKEVDE